MNDAPIGVFDSGVGGRAVARAIRAQLPQESLVYIGDTAHSPYGPKPIAAVRRYSIAVLDTLVDQGVKMLVVACNTASAAVLRDARERYDVPVVEVIGPAVRRAVSTTRNGRVGVIGTVGTIGSRAYQDMLEVDERLEVFTAACPRFVEFVEAGITGTPEVLAVMGDGVSLVSCADETAADVCRQLVKRDQLASPGAVASYVYEATGASADDFTALANRLMGHEVRDVQLVQTGVIDLPYLLDDEADAVGRDGIARP